MDDGSHGSALALGGRWVVVYPDSCLSPAISHDVPQDLLHTASPESSHHSLLVIIPSLALYPQ